MPYAVTHMLVPMILLDMIRDKILKLRKKDLPNKYILIAGIFGILPDIDVPLSLLALGDLSVHRTFTHTVWVPLFFFVGFSLFYILKNQKWFKIFLMCFVGVSTHIFLDVLLAGSASLFYPLSGTIYGLNVFPINKMYLLYASMDALLLFFWFARMGLRKRISDFF